MSFKAKLKKFDNAGKTIEKRKVSFWLYDDTESYNKRKKGIIVALDGSTDLLIPLKKIKKLFKQKGIKL